MSSPSLSDSLIRGVLSQGLDVVYSGVIPTPLLYFAISHYKLDGGITVSASHNPPEWNGFKVCRKDAYVIGLGSGLEEIREMVKKDDFEDMKEGKLVDRSAEVMRDYLDALAGKIEPLKGLRVGMDPGNGAYSRIATETFARKGAEVHAINDVPDGRFPSRSPEPNPSTIKELIRLVTENGLDMGVAFDGDGDRVLFVTEKGDVIGGDTALALMVKEYLKKGEKVAYEPSCSSAVEDEIRETGGVPLLTKVGHSHFKEISGHMYFKETYGADDGLFASLKMAELLCRKRKKLSELVAQLPKYYKHFEEFETDDRKKFSTVEAVAKEFSRRGYRIIDIDGVKAVTEDGWLLIRASNTGPKIKMSAEAKTEKRLKQLVEMGRKEIKTAAGG
jgi:phosphomannomutase